MGVVIVAVDLRKDRRGDWRLDSLVAVATGDWCVASVNWRQVSVGVSKTVAVCKVEGVSVSTVVAIGVRAGVSGTVEFVVVLFVFVFLLLKAPNRGGGGPRMITPCGIGV